MTESVFSTIVGHDAIVARLQHALEMGRPGHAWLFHGPGGVGKRTLALAWIQSLFCSTPIREASGVSGCGRCLTCRKCAEGHHPDLRILEVEENKSRISVDQVRDLTRFIAFTPLEAAWKAAIIDDAAWMNEAAANALLKTLEEPPSGSLLILVTERPGALLPTIRSRCLKERFALLDDASLTRLLERLAPESDPDARQAAIGLAGGSVGVALRWCDVGMLEGRQRLFCDLDALGGCSLADLIESARVWSESERFALVPELLETWCAERIHQEVAGGRAGEVERWLETVSAVTSLLRACRTINLNPRLTLESIFIRLARMRGVAF